MSYNAKQYAEALYLALAETKPSDRDKVLNNFVKVLAENGDIPMYGQIEKEYKSYEETQKGIKQVEITTANPIQAKTIVQELNKVIGNKADVKEKIDQSIIGGVVVRVDDTLIDASIKNNLNQLRKQITS